MVGFCIILKIWIGCKIWGKERRQGDSVVWSLGDWKQSVSIYRDGEDCRRNKIMEEKLAAGS